MKLLLDQNLSRKLIRELSPLFPESCHVLDVDLDQATDKEVWDYARTHGFTIVSKDSDFRQLAFLLGPPPKAVWLRAGNATTVEILTLLLDQHERLFALDESEEDTLLVLTLSKSSDPA